MLCQSPSYKLVAFFGMRMLILTVAWLEGAPRTEYLSLCLPGKLAAMEVEAKPKDGRKVSMTPFRFYH